jgi:hypothetical protein
LATLVEKVEVIGRELGSLGAVVAEEISNELDAHGVTPRTRERVEQLSQPHRQAELRAELESTRKLDSLRDEVHSADCVLQASRKRLRFSPELLREVVNVGFELAGTIALTQRTPAKREEPATYALPELPDGWQTTVDTLRPARKRDQ